MRLVRTPSPAVMLRLAGKGFGAKTAVIPSIRDLVELLSGHKAGMLAIGLRVDTGKWYGFVQALSKLHLCSR